MSQQRTERNMAWNDPHYQGKSDAGTVRALLESQITEAEMEGAR